jgi:hypothetical protein
MTSQELAIQLRDEVDRYDYPRVEGILGALWTPERVNVEIALLRNALVEPSQRTLHVYERPNETVWLVAALDEVAIYFDEARGEYGLGSIQPDGSVRDWGVYGDLLGTFMAR